MAFLSIILLLGVFFETSFLCVQKITEQKNRNKGRRKIFVDTSVLIDGRILDIAKTGFLSDNFLIPRSVTRELQLLADGKDMEKRSRARKGMNVINELERVVFFDTEIFDDREFGRMPVDERLLVLSKRHHGFVLTCDYNLAKIAEAEKIPVLNINDLATVLTSEYQSGDEIILRITEKGGKANQGIGYTKDGTMVVVNGGKKFINEEIQVIVSRSFQTNTGKMIFATVKPVRKSRRHLK